MRVAIETIVSVVKQSVIYREAFQGVEAKSDMAPKIVDELLPYTDKRQKLAEKVCDKDIQFTFNSSLVLFRTVIFVPNQTGDRQSHKWTTKWHQTPLEWPLSWTGLHVAGLAQWWERSPSTNVSRVRFPDSASYVGWVCWFSTLLRGVFLRALRFFPLWLNQHLIWFGKCKAPRSASVIGAIEINFIIITISRLPFFN